MRNKLIFSFFIILLSLNANAFETNAKQAILMDYRTGKILFEKNADERMTPSSMTKLMTLDLLFERLDSDILKLEDEFTVSVKAWKTGGSKMFLRHTERVSIENLIKGIAVQSGNDACITVAEGISSSEESFAELMNKKAKELGMENSHFVNSTGLPDDEHYSSARDLSILARNMIGQFPDYYHYFSIPEFTHSDIKQPNRNTLLFRDIGVDGLKTGHTDDGGYGMVASSKENGKRLIVVVNGLKNELERADEAEKLLNYGFRYFADKKFYKSGDVIDEAAVWQGVKDTVPLVAANDIILMIPKLKEDKVKLVIKYDSPIQAPVKKGDQLATLTITVPESGTQSFALVAGDDVEQSSWLSRAMSNARAYFFGGL